MKKKMLVVLIVSVLSGGIYAATECLKPPNIITPFPSDPNRAPIAWMEIQALSTYSSEIRVCDPDEDPMVVEVIEMPTGATFDGTFWSWTPTLAQLGANYFVFKVTDIPPTGLEALSDEATYVVNVLRLTNRAPAFVVPF